MKYLSSYRLFESLSENNLSDIEEAFYNISDIYPVVIDKKKIGVPMFTTPIMHFKGDLAPVNYTSMYEIEKIDAVERTYTDDLNTVVIKGNHTMVKIIDFNSIKDDLDFAINYLKKELGLNLEFIHVNRLYIKDVFSPWKYPRNLLYKNFNILLNDKIPKNDILTIGLYFI